MCNTTRLAPLLAPADRRHPAAPLAPAGHLPRSPAVPDPDRAGRRGRPASTPDLRPGAGPDRRSSPPLAPLPGASHGGGDRPGALAGAAAVGDLLTGPSIPTAIGGGWRARQCAGRRRGPSPTGGPPCPVPPAPDRPQPCRPAPAAACRHRRHRAAGPSAPGPPGHSSSGPCRPAIAPPPAGPGGRCWPGSGPPRPGGPTPPG